MRILLLRNPRSGLWGAGLFDYVHDLGMRGADVTVRYMPEDRPIEETLADATDFDRVVAVGGDGTVSGVAYALRGSRVPLVAYPAGTANLVAFNLGMPNDPRALAEVTLDGGLADVDVGELTYQRALTPAGEEPSRTIGFVMVAGAGFDADVIAGARDLKGVIGPAAYLVAALQNLVPRKASFTLSLDGEHVETEGIAVMLANFTRLQFDIAVAHDTNAQDGLMDVIVLATKNVPELLPAIWAGLLDGFVDIPERPGIRVLTASEVELYTDPPLPLQSDGEVLDGQPPVRAQMLPGAARFVVPGSSQLQAV